EAERQVRARVHRRGAALDVEVLAARGELDELGRGRTSGQRARARGRGVRRDVVGLGPGHHVDVLDGVADRGGVGDGEGARVIVDAPAGDAVDRAVLDGDRVRSVRAPDGRRLTDGPAAVVEDRVADGEGAARVGLDPDHREGGVVEVVDEEVLEQDPG